MKNSLKTIDLFAGVGGIRLGFEEAGFETVFANDFDPYCKETYDLNFSEPKLTIEDLWKIETNNLPEFDILLAGFPCQPFSIAGKQKGFADERGNLFYKILEILEKRKPKVFLLENVKNLKSHDNGQTLKIIKEKLHHLGYYVKIEILNSCTHGNVPQNRERIFIIGFLEKEMYEKFSFPEPIPLKISFKELLQEQVDTTYHYENKSLYDKIKNEINSYDTIYQWRRKYVRPNKKGICPTLTANMGTGGHNVPLIKTINGIRKLTPLECFYLQGFPKNYKLPKISDARLYKQAGNSVCVPILRRIALNIKKLF